MKTTTSHTPRAGCVFTIAGGRIGRRTSQKCRKQILEDRDVVVAGRKLGRIRGVRRRRQRVVLGRRQKRAVLPIARICDPLAAERMPSQVRIRAAFATCSGDGATRPSGIGRLEYSSSCRPSGLVSVCLNIQCGSSSDVTSTATAARRRQRRMRMAADVGVRLVERRAAGRRARHPLERKFRRAIGEQQAVRSPDRCRRTACSRSPRADRASSRRAAGRCTAARTRGLTSARE